MLAEKKQTPFTPINDSPQQQNIPPVAEAPMTTKVASISPLMPSVKELPASEICKENLLPVKGVLAKYNSLHFDSKIGILAVKLAREAYFGDHVLMRCTPKGRQQFPALPQVELNHLKATLFELFPTYWQRPEGFDSFWTSAQEAISQACKRIRKKAGFSKISNSLDSTAKDA